MDNAILLLVLLFAGTTLLAWAAIVGSSQAVAAYRNRFTEAAHENLSKMFVFVDTRRVFRVNLLAVIALPALTYLLTGNWILVAGSVVLAFAAPSYLYKHLAKRRLDTIEAGLPDALAQLAGAMRAGSTLSIAMENLVRETKGPISQEFALVLKEQRVGVPLEDALENLSTRIGSENVDLVVAAALVAKDVGGNLAEILDRLSRTLREKIAMEGKIKALTAQGKLQGWVVGLLPVGLILVLSQMEPYAIQALLSTVGGWVWLSLLILLEVMGLWMIRKIVAIDV